MFLHHPLADPLCCAGLSVKTKNKNDTRGPLLSRGIRFKPLSAAEETSPGGKRVRSMTNNSPENVKCYLWTTGNGTRAFKHMHAITHIEWWERVKIGKTSNTIYRETSYRTHSVKRALGLLNG